jgi:hypothetical protein
MKGRYGVILLDSTEIIFRIYEATDQEWKLVHYHSAKLFTMSDDGEIRVTDVMEVIAEFLTTQYAQHIAEWKVCSRHLPASIIEDLTKGLGFKIENITPLREQELLCKGMFTELW